MDIFEGYTTEEIVALGQAIYRDQIKELVKHTEKGKLVIIDVKSGDYEIDEDDITAVLRLRERKPDAITYAVRVGYRAVYTFSGGFIPEEKC
jgi:predicted site-specific integrase-resolvase